jgi:vacuolar iron transporter family protein
MTEEAAVAHAADVLADLSVDHTVGESIDDHVEIGSGMRAAVSSFAFFASGALIPVLPYLFGLTGIIAVAIASGLVGIALLSTGAIVGLLSGASPISRALRQLAIGACAAGATYLLGLLFGTVLH